MATNDKLPADYKSPVDNVRHYLHVGTCHITGDDNDNLKYAAMHGTPGLDVDAKDGGFWVGFEPGSGPREWGERFSEAFIAILKWAQALGCGRICIDCDGPVYENLEQFDW